MLRQYMFLPILVLRLGAAVSAQRVSIDVDILGPLDWLTEELEGVNEGVHHTDSLNEQTFQNLTWLNGYFATENDYLDQRGFAHVERYMVLERVVVDACTGYTTALSDLMHGLIDRSGFYDGTSQGTEIFNALSELRDRAFVFHPHVNGAISDTPISDKIHEATESAYDKIYDAINAYGPKNATA